MHARNLPELPQLCSTNNYLENRILSNALLKINIKNINVIRATKATYPIIINWWYSRPVANVLKWFF